jgi:hypothetical protein
VQERQPGVQIAWVYGQLKYIQRQLLWHGGQPRALLSPKKKDLLCMDNFIKEVPVGLDVSPAMSVENLAAVSAR